MLLKLMLSFFGKCILPIFVAVVPHASGMRIVYYDCDGFLNHSSQACILI